MRKKWEKCEKSKKKAIFVWKVWCGKNYVQILGEVELWELKSTFPTIFFNSVADVLFTASRFIGGFCHYLAGLSQANTHWIKKLKSPKCKVYILRFIKKSMKFSL